MRISIAWASVAVLCTIGVSGAAYSAQGFSINDAILMAVQTNPSVGEASANRRATEAELHQNQGVLLPQVRLEAQAGPTRTNVRDPAYFTPPNLPPLGNGKWLHGDKESVVVRQLLFDGFASIDEIWRQTARVDAAAARVHERTELIALDAAEAYVDVVRYTRLVALAEDHLRAHASIADDVRPRSEGGGSCAGDTNKPPHGPLAPAPCWLSSLSVWTRRARGIAALSVSSRSTCASLAGSPGCRRPRTTRLQSLCSTILPSARRGPMSKRRNMASARRRDPLFRP